nr:PH domain-containing protein [Terribacillus saccharophilus]
MVFRSKIDIFFVNFILIVILLLALASFWPLFFFNKIDLVVFLLLSSTFLIPAGVILWSVFSIKYVYYQDFLLVKGGPYKSRILYEDITKITSSNNIFSGYRILSARDAIEIYSKQAFWGSVTISPMCKEEFISELKKRCPNMNIRE